MLGNAVREIEDHHLERDHWGKKEKLEVEKLPNATSARNTFRGIPKHTKESM